MTSQRSLYALIAAVCPIDGISGGEGNVRIDFRPEATPEERLAAQAVVDAFDWSVEAEQGRVVGSARQKAAASLLTSGGATEVAVRANANATWFERNNVAEALWAAMELVCEAANIPVPTTQQITERITSKRLAAGQVFAYPSPQDAAERGVRRLTEMDILLLIQMILQSGGADPISP